MTQLLSILSTRKQKFQAKVQQTAEIHKVLERHLITNVYFDEGEVTFCLDNIIFRENQLQTGNIRHWGLIGTIRYISQVCTISLCLLDQQHCMVRASAAYQKIGLLRLAFLLNSYSEFFHIKANPMTGEFCFSRSFWSQNINLTLLLDETLYSLQKQRNLFYLTFQFLQKLQPSQNQFLKFLQQKLGNSSMKDSEIAEEFVENFSQHSQYFFTDKNQFKNFRPPQAFMSRNFQKKDVAAGRLAKDPKTIGKTNFAIKSLKQPLNFKFLKQKKTEHTSQTDLSIPLKVLTTSSETLSIKAVLDNPERVFDEYKKCEKAARKFYFTFLKQYISIKGQGNLSNFIFHMDQKNTKLRCFLQKNMLTISMATRLKLSYDIALILMLCSEAITGFSIRIDIDNLQVGKNLNLKLERIHQNSANMSEETSKTIMRVLFGNQLPIMNRKCQKMSVFTPNISSFQIIGPQIVATLIRKPLLDMIKNKFVEMQAPTTRQNLLMVLQVAYDFYQKDQDIKESWSRVQRGSLF